jgi:hypothetical protein
LTNYIVQNGALVSRAVPLTQAQYAILSTSGALQAQAQYEAALAAGIQIVSTSTPALNGTYFLDDSTQIMLLGEANFINIKGTFSNGSATGRTWKDMSQNVHVFPTTALFLAFAEAVAQHVNDLETAWMTAVQSGTWTAPAQPVTIP